MKKLAKIPVVRAERLELSRLAALEPKSSASTNSATLAHLGNKNIATRKEGELYLRTAHLSSHPE
jgi:hypothetical protein